MPTYEYACKACDHNFEIVQSFSEDSLTTCPQCEQDELRKVYNAAGIIFKGEGWHIKDYGTSGSSTAASSGEGGSDSSSETAGSDTKGSDSKGSDSKGSSSATSGAKGSGSSSRSAAS